MKGPKFKLSVTCNNCEFCRTEFDEYQGVTDYIHHCDEAKRKIGTDTLKTPEWCPLLTERQKELIEECA